MRPFLAPLAIFLVASVVFFIGLGVGLTQSPAGGNLLWLLAAGLGIWAFILLIRRVDARNEQNKSELEHSGRGG